MKKFIIICILLTGLFAQTFAQEETVEVKGTIVDEQNDPIVGVNIYVTDVAGLGTVSNVDGEYSIKVPTFKKLTFSFIGFEKHEVLIKEAQTLNVQLKVAHASQLDEVVVTGAGVQKKVSITGAITTIDVADLKSTPSSNITNALAGNVPGIMAMTTSGQPGRNISEFWIRGISTFGASTAAYVLVDGFERDLNEVNIEDIKSFTVLKDASATAIYGSKGANGVVLIETKRGAAGKVKINAKVETSYNTRTVTPEFEDGITYANLMNESRITRNRAPIYQPEELEILRLGLDPDLYPNVDWQDLLLKDGAMSYRANLNISGGGPIARYYVSGSYSEDQGMYNTDDAIKDDYNTNANYRLWTYRLNTDMNITKTTLLKVGVSGSLSKRNSPGLGDNDVWGELFGYNAIRTPITYSNGYIPTISADDNKINPWVAATQTGFNENWENKIQTNISLEQDFSFITPGLRFTGRFGYDTNNYNTISRHKWPELWRAERVRDPQGDLIFTKIRDPREMKQSSSSRGDRREFLDMRFNWDRNFNGHNLSATAKYTQDSYVRTQNLGDDLRNGVAERNQALAGRIAYNWKLKYFVDFNFGYTGSESFARGQQYGFFPAFSAAWNLGEESFIKNNSKWINMFKIRFSHGKVGNDKLEIDGKQERFPYLYTIESGGAGYEWADYTFNNNFSGMHYSRIASPYVTWEVATKDDLGLDVSLFGDKFIANVDYFREKRKGIYMRREFLPDMVGLESTPRANVGAVKSEGFDGKITYKQKINEVDFTLRANLTYSKNKILEKDEENNVYPYQMEEGYRVGQAKGLIALGLFEDYDDIRNSPTQQFGSYQPGDIKYKDVNGDGVVNDGDIVAIGSTERPNLIYGAGASARWKGLDINVHFQGAGKSSFFIYGKTVYAFSEGEWGTILKGMTDDRWISADISGDPATENPNASYPRLSFGGNGNNYRNSTFWLRNGSYIRLKTVDIGYTIPKHIANRFRCDNVRIFVMGTNLVTWSDFKLWDPEMNNPRGEVYPLPKSITFGVSLNL